MSKKKAFSGSTMTLKDFHGGSIPSDISLPSAPGLYVFFFSFSFSFYSFSYSFIFCMPQDLNNCFNWIDFLFLEFVCSKELFIWIRFAFVTVTLIVIEIPSFFKQDCETD